MHNGRVLTTKKMFIYSLSYRLRSRFEKEEKSGGSQFPLCRRQRRRRSENSISIRWNWMLVDRVERTTDYSQQLFPLVHLIQTKEERSMLFTRGQRRTRCNDSNDSPQNPLQA